MRIKLLTIFFVFNLFFIATYGQDNKNFAGVFTQKIFYRFIIVEFNSDHTFEYHVMSERAHEETKGKYRVLNDTLILNSYQTDSEFDFVNEKWILLSRNKILISNNENDRRENWSVLKRDKQYSYLPKGKSDLKLKIDSIKVNELSWTKDTTNYNSELKVIIREPQHPKEPLIILNGEPIKYQYLLNFYHLKDIDTITYYKSSLMVEKGIPHGGQALNGVIIINTKNKKTRR